MNKTDHRHHHTVTPGSIYTCIRVVPKLVNELDSSVVFGVAIATTNMIITQDTNTVDLLLNTPPVLFLLPAPTQPDPQEIVLLSIKLES